MKTLLLLCGLLVFGGGYSQAQVTARRTTRQITPAMGPTQQRAAPVVTQPPRPAPEEKTSREYKDVDEPLTRFAYRGTVYPEARLKRVGREFGFVKIESGMVRVRLDELPEPAKSKYFNVEIATAAEAEREKSHSELLAAREAANSAGQEQWREQNLRWIDGRLEPFQKWPTVKGRITSFRDGGAVVQTTVTRVSTRPGSHDYRGSIGAYRSSPPSEEVVARWTEPGPSIFVKNLGKGSPAEVSCKAKRVGSIQVGSEFMDTYDAGLPYVPAGKP